MASLALNQHGYFSIRFRWKGEQCCEGFKVRGKKVDGKIVPENRKEYDALVQYAADISREIRLGKFDYLAHFPHGNKAHLFRPGGPELFKDFSQRWLKEKAPPVTRAATHSDYSTIVRNDLDPLFGSHQLSYFMLAQDEVTRKLQDSLVKRDLSPPRLTYIFKLLRSILKKAKIDFEIPKFAGAKRRRKLQYFPEHERDLLLKRFDPFWEPFFTVAFFTGMRPSEQIALQDDDLDFAHKKISIFRSVVDGVEGPPKTEESQRMIDMLPEAEAALIRFKEQRSKLKRVKTKFFFCTKHGDGIRVDALLTKVWYPAFDGSELRRRVMYSTRHTFASVFLSRGFDAAWVAHMMGDRFTTILKHYYTFIPRHVPTLNH